MDRPQPPRARLYINAFECIEDNANEFKLIAACQRLFVGSDLFRYSQIDHPFSDKEIEAISIMIYTMISDASLANGDVINTELLLTEKRAVLESVERFSQFAEVYSRDFLSQNCVTTEYFKTLSTQLKKFILEEFLIGIWYSYLTCSITGGFFSMIEPAYCCDLYKQAVVGSVDSGHALKSDQFSYCLLSSLGWQY